MLRALAVLCLVLFLAGCAANPGAPDRGVNATPDYSKDQNASGTVPAGSLTGAAPGPAPAPAATAAAPAAAPPALALDWSSGTPLGLSSPTFGPEDGGAGTGRGVVTGAPGPGGPRAAGEDLQADLADAPGFLDRGFGYVGSDFGGPAKTTGKYEVVRVFFGTDRGRSADVKQTPVFSAEHAPAITYGSVDVSIPQHHATGRIESPPLWRVFADRDPTRDVTVLKVAVTPYDQFRDELRSKALNASTPSVLLFIHGYNVSFEDAAMRTAQMARDLQFAGAPVLFSWPSRANLFAYFNDEAAIERAQDDIEHFVTQVLAATPGANLYVIAHSMGNRGMTRALVGFARAHPEQAGRIREVILAAPDIDTDVFVHQIAPSLVAIGAPVTLYASSTDHALRISEAIHGGPRAGDSGDSMVLLRGIETIDVTNVDTDLTGHSYVGDQRTILSDLYYIVRNDTRASGRFGLTRQTRNGSEYWVFNR
ncbi:alpha/beta hydrolase [Paraburkholderia sp. EG285A]|uniref:alpha/beta hydrolase n=1 Tax=Paraburkholderia sp. EG285A TaxID=3237009 RepID=UPI0034D3383D